MKVAPLRFTDRVLFICLALLGNSASAAPAAGVSWESSRMGRSFLELGPMLGHVSSTQAIIWVQASAPAPFAVRFGTRSDLSDSTVVRGPHLSDAAACMGQVTLRNLAPGREYFYSVQFNGRAAMSPPYPSFTTPPPEAEPGRVRFAFLSCVGYHGYDAAAGYSDLAARTNVDLVLMLGDNHYANTNDPGIQRAFYADQRRQSGWRELTARTPVYAIWDDHDYGPDNSDGTMPGKELSLRTFQEHWANPAYGEPDNPGVYSKFSRGGVDFFLLDVRYYRDPNKATNLVHKTMLGEKQLAWLKRELLASNARIKCLIAGSEWQSNGTDDSWTSFQRERDDLFQFLEANRIEGILLISGDRHFTGAYQVKGKWIEVTSGPFGSGNATTRNLPEMFLNFSNSKAKFYCIYDLDTRLALPLVTLEIYKVAEGLVERRAFTWEEVLGKTRIKLLPVSPGKADAKRVARQ